MPHETTMESMAETKHDDGSPLKIQLVFGPTGCTSGGLSVDVSSIANHLTARGHSVSVMTTASEHGEDQRYVRFSQRVNVQRLPHIPLGNMAARVSLSPGSRRLTYRAQPDIVHVFSLAPNYLHAAAFMAAQKYRIPLVISPMMHPVRAATWGGRGITGIAMRAFDATIPRVAARADLVVTATGEEEEFFRSLGARQLAIAPPGVEPCDVAAAGEIAALRRRVGLAEAAPVVTTVSARTEPRKGLDLLRSVAADLDRELPDARILIVGFPGDILHGRNIVYTGRLDNKDLALAYGAADVVFVPSRYEAFSRVVIEGWQQARPAVVTNGVGLASEVKAGAGLVVPADDRAGATEALLRLLTDRHSADVMGHRGRELVREKYEWPRVIDTLESVYRQLWSRHSSR